MVSKLVHRFIIFNKCFYQIYRMDSCLNNVDVLLSEFEEFFGGG